jgi:hypothetical protein
MGPGETLAKVGEVGQGLIIILSGQVDITQHDESGRRVPIITHGPGDSILIDVGSDDKKSQQQGNRHIGTVEPPSIDTPLPADRWRRRGRPRRVQFERMHALADPAPVRRKIVIVRGGQKIEAVSTCFRADTLSGLPGAAGTAGVRT